MADWNPEQYLKFERERTQPVYDLMARIPLPEKAVRRILDVGCGPGNSTRALKERFPNAYILGIDVSQDMVDAAKRADPHLDFQLCDATTFLHTLPTDFDLVFSNACIHWMPDHEALIPTLLGLLRTGGCLAVQIPMSDKQPIHGIIEGLAGGTWRDKIKHPRVYYSLSQHAYYDLLSKSSTSFALWETVYFHIVNGHSDIMEWYRGTGLRPYLAALSPGGRGRF